MGVFDVLGMQNSPFESRRQEKYLNPKLTSFQIIIRASISSTRGKVKSKNIDFLKSYNWQMLCWVVISLFTIHVYQIFHYNKLWTF